MMQQFAKYIGLEPEKKSNIFDLPISTNLNHKTHSISDYSSIGKYRNAKTTEDNSNSINNYAQFYENDENPYSNPKEKLTY